MESLTFTPLKIGVNRYYFQDLDGNNLESHPLNGVAVDGAGPYILSDDKKSRLIKNGDRKSVV